MKNVLWLFAVCVGACLMTGCASSSATASTVAQATTTKPPQGWARTIPLWVGSAPGALGNGDGDIPKLFTYPADTGKPTESGKPAAPSKVPTAAVIVIPGGGYVHLSIEREGGEEARWLNSHGMTAFVLEYRLGPRYHFPVPMEDGARAVRYVRAHAKEFNVDPKKVGLWGFSAGAHLAAYLAAEHDDGAPKAADPIDRESGRPDFVIASYGRFSMDKSIPRKTNLEGLLGNNPTQKMMDSISVVKMIDKTAPPFFIYSTSADKQVSSLNATALYDALEDAGVPVELHIFERGPHGTGLPTNIKLYPELGEYPALLIHWLEIHGWMTPEADKETAPEPSHKDSKGGQISNRISTKVLSSNKS